jgi:hypothetical protein
MLRNLRARDAECSTWCASATGESGRHSSPFGSYARNWSKSFSQDQASGLERRRIGGLYHGYPAADLGQCLADIDTS